MPYSKVTWVVGVIALCVAAACTADTPTSAVAESGISPRSVINGNSANFRIRGFTFGPNFEEDISQHCSFGWTSHESVVTYPGTSHVDSITTYSFARGACQTPYDTATGAFQGGNVTYYLSPTLYGTVDADGTSVVELFGIDPWIPIGDLAVPQTLQLEAHAWPGHHFNRWVVTLGDYSSTFVYSPTLSISSTSNVLEAYAEFQAN